MTCSKHSRSAAFGRICNHCYFWRVKFSGNAQNLPARAFSCCALATLYDWQLNCFSLGQTKWRATGHSGKYFGQRSFRVPLCNFKILLDKVLLDKICWTRFCPRKVCWALRSVPWQPSPGLQHDPTQGDRAGCWFPSYLGLFSVNFSLSIKLFGLAAVDLVLLYHPARTN